MELIYKCQICHDEFPVQTSLVYHIISKHHKNTKDYYDTYLKKPNEGKCKRCGADTTFNDFKHGYREYCSKCKYECTSKIEDCQCAVCGKTIKLDKTKRTVQFSWHLREHNLTLKEYYDSYIKKPDEGICKFCGKPTKFIDIYKGYNDYCGRVCAVAANRAKHQEIIKQNNLWREQKLKQKQEQEDQLQVYIKQLKENAAQYDWEGERNTWVYGNKPTAPNNKDGNILTDNSLSYIEGQTFSDMKDTIEECDTSSFDSQFWL